MPSHARILIVDDDPISLRILVRALASRGYEIRTAADGVEGLAAAIEFPPDLTVSDKIMPHMDGFELCRRVKAHPALASAMFVILTSGTEPETRVEGLEQGADDYLVLPIPAEELKARVCSIVRRRPLPGPPPEGSLPGVAPVAKKASGWPRCASCSTSASAARWPTRCFLIGPRRPPNHPPRSRRRITRPMLRFRNSSIRSPPEDISASRGASEPASTQPYLPQRRIADG
jgi:CheY-like chemotaxis protein